MGNHSGCSCFYEPRNKNMAMVVDSEGHMTLVGLPISVVELMIEHPGFGLSPEEDIRRTRRLLAMKIHEILTPRKLYLLLRMEKLFFRVSDLQISAINSLSKPVRKKEKTDWDCLKGLLGNCSQNTPNPPKAKAWSPALESMSEE